MRLREVAIRDDVRIQRLTTEHREAATERTRELTRLLLIVGRDEELRRETIKDAEFPDAIVTDSVTDTLFRELRRQIGEELLARQVRREGERSDGISDRDRRCDSQPFPLSERISDEFEDPIHGDDERIASTEAEATHSTSKTRSRDAIDATDTEDVVHPSSPAESRAEQDIQPITGLDARVIGEGERSRLREPPSPSELPIHSFREEGDAPPLGSDETIEREAYHYR